MAAPENTYCYYSDLPSPMAYMEVENEKINTVVALSDIDINRIIEMAWEDRTPFEAIKAQFGLSENDVKAVMKKNIKFSSYTLWRERVHHCNTKHAKKRNTSIDRFRCALQRSITSNKISKRHTK
jgi:uncharacterized protein (TIGR03643 family)